MPRLFRPVLVLVNVTHIVFIYLGYICILSLEIVDAYSDGHH